MNEPVDVEVIQARIESPIRPSVTWLITKTWALIAEVRALRAQLAQAEAERAEALEDARQQQQLKWDALRELDALRPQLVALKFKLDFLNEIGEPDWCGEHPRRFAVDAGEGDDGPYDQCQKCRAEQLVVERLKHDIKGLDEIHRHLGQCVTAQQARVRVLEKALSGRYEPAPSLPSVEAKEEPVRRSPHNVDCDIFDIDPAIGRATKPCNCAAPPAPACPTCGGKQHYTGFGHGLCRCKPEPPSAEHDALSCPPNCKLETHRSAK